MSRKEFGRIIGGRLRFFLFHQVHEVERKRSKRRRMSATDEHRKTQTKEIAYSTKRFMTDFGWVKFI